MEAKEELGQFIRTTTHDLVTYRFKPNFSTQIGERALKLLPLGVLLESRHAGDSHLRASGRRVEGWEGVDTGRSGRGTLGRRFSDLAS